MTFLIAGIKQEDEAENGEGKNDIVEVKWHHARKHAAGSAEVRDTKHRSYSHHSKASSKNHVVPAHRGTVTGERKAPSNIKVIVPNHKKALQNKKEFQSDHKLALSKQEGGAPNTYKARLKFAALWDRYNQLRGYTPEKVGEEIGGKIGEALAPGGGFNNACAIRMSAALHNAGLNITGLAKSNKLFMVKGADGKNYLPRVTDLQKLLAKTVGEPKVVSGPEIKDLQNFKGIVVFTWEPEHPSLPGHHATLYNGAEFPYDDAKYLGKPVAYKNVTAYLYPFES